MQYQSSTQRDKVRDFFIKYQDRILYATDIPQDAKADAAQLRESIHRQWLSDWKYLCTDSTMTVRDFERPFQGLKLPRETVDRIYRLNAERTFPKAWKM
jgi:predicted TIM-barrel fold metal-dependent hydrolase